MSAAALLGVGGSGNANVSVDVGPGNDGSLELQLLGEGVHPRDPFLEPPAGADVAINRGHPGSIGLWNSSRNGEMSGVAQRSILPVCVTPLGKFRTSDSHPTLPVRAPRADHTYGTTLETLAYVGGSRWRIETEFETEKGDVGLDEYETRSWAGWHHHIAMCLLGGAFLLSLQQDWGEKDAPDHEATGVPGGAGDAAPGAVRARSIAVVAGGYAATQRTGSPFPRETPLHPPRKQDGAATLNPSL